MNVFTYQDDASYQFGCIKIKKFIKTGFGGYICK
ncbi:hypothetical protein HCH_04157 [Hahella chejuensis KCTC 2396]|uniref:Uncharacterized protein n=1 Tax=Hahella chejuensis (strain KCTC 2396) TaxID=349521 RepID=Q2SEQ8_HAHCH|nr:hypothetical protein HCH_04157 [Hahella chejuensis KCTC 2396]